MYNLYVFPALKDTELLRILLCLVNTFLFLVEHKVACTALFSLHYIDKKLDHNFPTANCSIKRIWPCSNIQSDIFSTMSAQL